MDLHLEYRSIYISCPFDWSSLWINDITTKHFVSWWHNYLPFCELMMSLLTILWVDDVTTYHFVSWWCHYLPFCELMTLQLTSQDQLSTWVLTERQAAQFTREFPVSSVRIKDTTDKIAHKILHKFAISLFTSVILNEGLVWYYW